MSKLVVECPICGSSEHWRLGENGFECYNCKTEFELTMIGFRLED